MARSRKNRRWLRVGAFFVCTGVEDARADRPPTLVRTEGPLRLEGVWHELPVRNPFAAIGEATPAAPLILFGRLCNRNRPLTGPRELQSLVFHHQPSGVQFLGRFPFVTQSFPAGRITYVARPLPDLTAHVREASWVEIVLVTDDDPPVVLARTEVYLTP